MVFVVEGASFFFDPRHVQMVGDREEGAGDEACGVSERLGADAPAQRQPPGGYGDGEQDFRELVEGHWLRPMSSRGWVRNELVPGDDIVLFVRTAHPSMDDAEATLLVMEDRDGAEALEEIENQRGLCRVPVVDCVEEHKSRPGNSELLIALKCVFEVCHHRLLWSADFAHEYGLVAHVDE